MFCSAASSGLATSRTVQLIKPMQFPKAPVVSLIASAYRPSFDEMNSALIGLAKNSPKPSKNDSIVSRNTSDCCRACVQNITSKPFQLCGVEIRWSKTYVANIREQEYMFLVVVKYWLPVVITCVTLITLGLKNRKCSRHFSSPMFSNTSSKVVVAINLLRLTNDTWFILYVLYFV